MSSFVRPWGTAIEKRSDLGWSVRTGLSSGQRVARSSQPRAEAIWRQIEWPIICRLSSGMSHARGGFGELEGTYRMLASTIAV
ncbi:hypothetical protein ACOMHN_055192 [Nucella lapillus]